MNSKALKDWDDEKKPWWNFAKPAYWFIEKWWWKLVWDHVKYLQKVFAYAKLLRTDYDFDAQCLFRIIHLKLTRVKRSLLNGWAIQEEKDMRALDLAIKLAARLDNDHDYYWRPHTRHDRKWGDLHSWFEPVDPSNPNSSSYWRSSRPNAVTDEQKEQERKEFLDSCYAEEFLRSRDRRLLFAILAKYIPVWWD